MKMKYRIGRKRIKINLVLISVILILNILMAGQEFNQNSNMVTNNSLNSKKIENQKNPNISAANLYFTNISWLENANFSSSSINPWFNTTSGDSTDIIASNSSGQADFLVLGDNGTIEISNVFTDISSWKAFNKTDLDLNPTNIYNDSTGVYCDHLYTEDPNQFPVIYWRYNVSLGRDMSDYEITTASFEAVMNASVDWNFDVLLDSDAHAGPDPINNFELFDSIYTTVEISDMEVSDKNTYLIADNRTHDLGSEISGFYSVEENLTPKPPKDIAFYLERVLGADTEGHDNFTIVLGIAIDCADNSDNGDIDEVLYARIKSLNLTFSYKKKMDILTSLSWSQRGNAINYTSPQVARVTNAVVNFDYKIDKNWTETTNYTAENSEFRVLINGNPSEDYPTIKLNKANETYQEAISGSYDVTQLIPLKENITLSIQVYLADDFVLDQPLNISIDNILFNISYYVFTVTGGGGGAVIAGGDDGGKDVVKEEPWINLVIAIAAIAGAIGIGGYLVAYQLYLKYPKTVRKIRKYRRTLKRKGDPSVEITSKEKSINAVYKEHSSTVSNLPKGKISGKVSPSPKTIGKIDKKPST